jgi:hypothetical protein
MAVDAPAPCLALRVPQVSSRSHVVPHQSQCTLEPISGGLPFLLDGHFLTESGVCSPVKPLFYLPEKRIVRNPRFIVC